MTVNVNCVENGCFILTSSFFNFECPYFTINRSARFRIFNFSVPIERYYLSDIRMLLYLKKPSYDMLYDYCKKVGILC